MSKEYPTLMEALFPDEKQRGGKRKGAGRKRKHYEKRVCLRCYESHANLVRSFINILESSSDLQAVSAWIKEQEGKEQREV